MNDVVKIELATKPPTKQRGRPLAFNQDVALDKALNVFWSRGYEGASMAELTEALGINKPSIYAAFGNKETLFRKTLARYTTGAVAFVGEAMKEPTAHQAVEKLLMQAVNFFCDNVHSKGNAQINGDNPFIILQTKIIN